jgi:hypothetical protein
MNKGIAAMINRLNPKVIQKPTYRQAILHLVQTVEHADKQKVNSVTIEAIRSVLEALQGPGIETTKPS